jgi:hypothetical protein
MLISCEPSSEELTNFAYIIDSNGSVDHQPKHKNRPNAIFTLLMPVV